MPKNSFANQCRELIKFMRTLPINKMSEEERDRLYGAWNAAEEWLNDGGISHYSNEDFDIFSRLNSALAPYKNK